MARIIALGSALSDVYLIDHDDLTPTNIGGAAIFGKVLVGSKVDIDRLEFAVGGGGVNAAVAFSRHGHETILMANVGQDQAGQAILALLDREGVDSSYVATRGRKPTGTSVILLDSKSGERTILTHRGASAEFANLSEEDLELSNPDWLYITSLRGDLNTLERFLKKAHAMGIRVMLNPGVKELAQAKELLRLLKYTHVLLVNKSEAAELVPGTLLAELVYHLQGYTPVVIITDGAMGGIATDGQATYRFGIYEDVRAKDATGAGDAFGAGFLAHLAAGHSFRNSLVFASANSTAVVANVGANRNILTGREQLHPMPIQKI